jgi:peptide/nickel transport system substrate-binding protein
MTGKHRSTAVVVALALVVAGCTSSDEPSAPDDASAGGTMYALVPAEEVSGLDPQRIYDVEGSNLATSFLLRSLVMLDPDDEGSSSGLLPDLATDTGRPNEDASVWQFTLRDGATFEDGTAVECEHVAYGVSRSFALDVITDGPTWLVDMLDIPVLDDGTSAYKGPYTAEGQDFFNEAVTCDGSTITFRLKQPQGDFNQVAAFPALGPVKPEADTGEGYNDAPLATGPYRVESYDKGQRLVLVRSQAWDPATDPHRPAYPDRVEFVLGLGPAAIDEQIITGSGNGRFAVPAGGGMQASNLERVFSDDSMADRRLDVLDPFVMYVAINTTRVPVLETDRRSSRR